MMVLLVSSLLSGSGPRPLRSHSAALYGLWWLCNVVRKAPSAAATRSRIPLFVASGPGSMWPVRPSSTRTTAHPAASAKWRDGSSEAVVFRRCKDLRLFSSRSETHRHPDRGSDAAVAGGSAMRSASSSSFARVLGHGDFAGLTANFHWPSGDLIEIPQHLVPKAMVEWGQAPTCLEVLTSEGGPKNGADDEEGELTASTSLPTMTRQTITVLPSIGCAVDNLETTKSTIHKFEVCSVLTSDCATTSDEEATWPVRVTVYWPANHMDRRRIVVEATFPMAHPLALGAVRDGDSEWEGHRIRMSIPLEITDADGIPNVQPASPVSITCERMVSKVSSRGTLADGGGLDGQSVSRMLGSFLRRSYDVFTKGEYDSSTRIANSIKRLHASSRVSDASMEGDYVLKSLALPCNTSLSVSRSIDDIQICIGHVDANFKSGSAADTAESFVHKTLQIRVPLMKPRPSDEAIILDPTMFTFAAQVVGDIR